jgi:hypothetical protein
MLRLHMASGAAGQPQMTKNPDVSPYRWMNQGKPPFRLNEISLPSPAVKNLGSPALAVIGFSSRP